MEIADVIHILIYVKKFLFFIMRWTSNTWFNSLAKYGRWRSQLLIWMKYSVYAIHWIVPVLMWLFFCRISWLKLEHHHNLQQAGLLTRGIILILTVQCMPLHHLIQNTQAIQGVMAPCMVQTLGTKQLLAGLLIIVDLDDKINNWSIKPAVVVLASIDSWWDKLHVRSPNHAVARTMF